MPHGGAAMPALQGLAQFADAVLAAQNEIGKVEERTATPAANIAVQGCMAKFEISMPVVAVESGAQCHMPAHDIECQTRSEATVSAMR